MASIPRPIGIEVYKLSMSHEQSTLSKFKKLGKNHNKSQSSFTYVVEQETIGFNKFFIRQLSRYIELSGPDIIGLAFRSYSWKTSFKYTFEKAKLIQSDYSQPYQVLNFLDIEVILHSNNTVETDIYYKDTNVHDYLPYNSAHPKHCKDSLP